MQLAFRLFQQRLQSSACRQPIRSTVDEQAAPTGRTPGSLAWAGLANTYYWIDQKKGVGGVYMTQVLPFADRTALPLFYAFEKAVYQSMS